MLKIFKAIWTVIISVTILSCNNPSENTNFPGFGNITSASPDKAGEKENILKDGWMGYYYKNRKLGYLHEIIKERSKKYEISGVGVLVFTIGRDAGKTSVSYRTVMDKDLRIENFFYRMDSSGREIVAEGKRDGDKIKIKIHNAGTTTEATEDVGEGVYSSASVPVYLARRGFKGRDNFRLKIFFEPLRKISFLDVEVIGREKLKVKGQDIEAFKVRQTVEGLSSTGWYDLKGRVLKEVSFQGFEARAESEEEAKSFKAASMGMEDLLSVIKIQTDRKIKDSSGIKSLTVRLRNIQDKNIILENQRQRILNIERFKGGYNITLEINRENFKEEDSVQMPIDKYKFYLKSTSLIQAENPEIKKVALGIMSSEKNAYRFSRSVIEWMKYNISQKLVDNFSALDTLKTQEGECQSISYLYAALLRASGIPCKVVGGIVYSEKFGGFMYHAWCEAYLGEWIDIDPTFGQVPADATHIVFFEAERGEELRLLQLISKLKVDLVEIEYDKV